MSWVDNWSDLNLPKGRVAPPVQDDRLFAPTKVRVLRPFCVGGKRCEVGEEATVPYHTALDLRNIGKASIVEK